MAYTVTAATFAGTKVQGSGETREQAQENARKAASDQGTIVRKFLTYSKT